MEIWFAAEQIKRRNDLYSVAYGFATVDPRVNVEAPAEIGVRVEYTHRGEPQTARYTGTSILPGVLLPHQCVLIRWWDREQDEKWRTNVL